MKFEEILPFMREGRKVRHGRMKEGEYWICAQAAFMDTSQTWPTITKVFENPFENERTRDANSYAWGIERWAIMDETWEIIDE